MKKFKYCIKCDEPHYWTENDFMALNSERAKLLEIACKDCKDKISKMDSMDIYNLYVSVVNKLSE